MAIQDEQFDELTLLRDEIIALQIKVAALEMLLLTDAQRADYERILKEQADIVLNLRARQNDNAKPN